MNLVNSKEEVLLDKNAVVSSLRETGLKANDIVLVHSALRTVGRVDGGARTIVEAILEVIGENGTLVAPAFTFIHEAEVDPVIDPVSDPSEMGAISEAVRRHPRALRSTAYRHSFAAIGRRAREITDVDPTLSPFDLRSSFGIMLALGTQILLLGVTYSSSTSHHFCEWLCDVPYRHTVAKRVKLRLDSGEIRETAMLDYQPRPSGDGSYYGKRTTDFNKLGSMLEERGCTQVAKIGNAVARKYALRDLCDLAVEVGTRDSNIFRTDEDMTGTVTPLANGEIVLVPLIDCAGRGSKYQWSVFDPSQIQFPEGVAGALLPQKMK